MRWSSSPSSARSSSGAVRPRPHGAPEPSTVHPWRLHNFGPSSCSERTPVRNTHPVSRTRPSEDDMNDNQGRRGPGPALLLLIPIALLIAKGASRRRRAWDSGGGYGHRHGFAGAGGDVEGRRGFRLPPKIEWMLDE